MLTGKARLAGVIGWPVAHSRSPRLHGHWLARHGIDGAYVPLPVAPDDLARVLPALARAGFAGVNVTLPHKEAALRLADEATAYARTVGAANTLIFKDGRILADNTDCFGFLADLRAHGVDPAGQGALVLGAGGAARAVVAALRGAGAAVTVTNRTRARAEALAAELGAAVLDWAAVPDALPSTRLLVNTTSLGMAGQPPLEIDLAPLPDGATVADIVYVPLETPLLRQAAARGLCAIGGLGMLLHQAQPGFSAWFGVTPAVDAELARVVAADIPRR